MSSTPLFFRVVPAFVALLIGLGSAASAQPNRPADSFDLILVGDSLRPAVHQLELKTNPVAGDTWTTIDGVECTGTEDLMVMPHQSVDRFLGQDVRENYVALRITSETAGGLLRAAYAVPSIEQIDENVCAQLAHVLETEPIRFRRHSLAVYERPRPVRLRPDTPFVDHVEAPVRHRKPGVMEVEWLEILFRPTD